MEEYPEENISRVPAEEIGTVKKKRKGARRVQDVLGGEYLSRESVIRNIPLLFYLAILAIVYIANTYYTERVYKEIETTKTELKELRYRYITSKSQLMFVSRLSEISGRAKEYGLKEPVIPPFRIHYTSDSTNTTPAE